MAREKVVLAYSGGLDTSIMVPWIQEKYGLDVITFTCDLGQGGAELESIKAKALKTGAIEAVIADARALFMDYFVLPALMGNALYEGAYPLATALGRPLIAWMMVDVAKKYGATAVAHGCTGKGNDQVRFDVTFRTLAPHLKIIAPVREWKMSRPDSIAYAAKHNIEVKATVENPFSVDQNLWGRSVECGALEDPWEAPPTAAFEWTVDPKDAPNTAELVTITFERGKPVALNGQKMDIVPMVEQLNTIGGRNGVGRIDLIENRLVGIKSRELYEAPAATILVQAHRELERLTLAKDALRFKELVSQQLADMIYNGLWFSAFHQDLMAYVASSQRFVTGEVRMRLLKGHCSIDGRRSDHSLYQKALATYDGHGDEFDQEAAQGFIRIHGLSQQTQARHQLLTDSRGVHVPSILPPPEAAPTAE